MKMNSGPFRLLIGQVSYIHDRCQVIKPKGFKSKMFNLNLEKISTSGTPLPGENVLSKALNICTVPALVAVEIAADPSTTSQIEDLVTANLEKIKTDQLSKQSDRSSNQGYESLPTKAISGAQNTFTPTVSPYDSLESDQRSYNANIHIEEAQSKSNRKVCSPTSAFPSPYPVNNTPNAATGGTHFDTAPFNPINTNTEINHFDLTSPIISILIELDEVLKKHMLATSNSTNPINTNHKLTADTEILFGDATGVIAAINHLIVDNHSDNSIDDDSIRKKLIPGRVVQG